jgi:hypothetical protein
MGGQSTICWQIPSFPFPPSPHSIRPPTPNQNDASTQQHSYAKGSQKGDQPGQRARAQQTNVASAPRKFTSQYKFYLGPRGIPMTEQQLNNNTQINDLLTNRRSLDYLFGETFAENFQFYF